MAISAIPTILLDEECIPRINGTTTKVIEVVLNQRATDSTPEELQPDMPHLSVDQIRAALAFYESHKQELDADIERRRRWAEELRKTEENPLRRKDLLAHMNPAE